MRGYCLLDFDIGGTLVCTQPFCLARLGPDYLPDRAVDWFITQLRDVWGSFFVDTIKQVRHSTNGITYMGVQNSTLYLRGIKANKPRWIWTNTWTSTVAWHLRGISKQTNLICAGTAQQQTRHDLLHRVVYHGISKQTNPHLARPSTAQVQLTAQNRHDMTCFASPCA